MYKILIIKIILFSNFLIGCTESKTKTAINKNHINTMIKDSISTITVLENQLKAGYAAEMYETDYPNFDYKIKDLEASALLLADILHKNGFRKIDTRTFKLKLEKIFQIGQTDTEYYHISLTDKCAKENDHSFKNFFDAPQNDLYIVMSEGIIIGEYRIPEIIDYKKIYPQSLNIEDSTDIKFIKNKDKIKIIRWKDLPNLPQLRKYNIQTVVARNRYLFNDDRSQLTWLLENDGYFMERLVKTFGWTEDRKLLKRVIERTDFNEKNPDEFGSLFWTKDCNGKLRMHSNTFKELYEIINVENGYSYLKDKIQPYFEYLSNFDNKVKDLTDEERIKILANVVYFSEQYKYDSPFEYKFNTEALARLRYFNTLNDDKIINEIEKNNYYGLPKFKEWWEKAKDDERRVYAEYEGGIY